MRCEKLYSIRTESGGGVRHCDREATVTIRSSARGVEPHPGRIVIGHYCEECAAEIRLHPGWQKVAAA
jgi:hypothetical protein